MKSQTIKNEKYMAVTMYRRQKRHEKLRSQLISFFFCLSVGCGVLYLTIASLGR